VTGHNSEDLEAIKQAELSICQMDSDDLIKTECQIQLENFEGESLQIPKLQGLVMFRNVRRMATFMSSFSILISLHTLFSAIYDGSNLLAITELLWLKFVTDLAVNIVFYYD